MKYLTTELVIKMHERLIETSGGIAGVRDMDLLSSALNAPFQTYGGNELYPSIPAKAARLGYGLIKNHAMIDGNKRIGAHSMLVFLSINGIELNYTQKELIEITLSVAGGGAGSDELLAWILNHQLP
jgi:death-on-curing protein